MNNPAFSAQFDPGCAWNPSPERYATDVHFIGGLTLSWSPGDWAATGEPNGHYVFFGTAFNDVNTAGVGTAGTNSPVFIDRRDVNNITIAEADFVPNWTYYWRVDEINDPCNHKGIIWEFKTVTDKATNPSPADGGGLKMPLELRWTAGDWSPSVHRVFFATSYVSCMAATTNTTPGYRGTVSSPVYPLSRLLDANAVEGISAFGPLEPNTTYYWRIDEDSYTGGNKKGSVWFFNTGYSILIEDFQEYDSTAELNSVWLEAPAVCSGDSAGSGRVTLIREGASYRYMQFSYDKTGGTGGRYFSEVAYPFSSTADWTGGGVLVSPPDVLELRYRGFAINSADPDYDRMYVAIEDADGDVSVTLNSDPDAQKTGAWTYWSILYSDLNDQNPDMDITKVSDLYLGAGERCLSYFAGGGDGNVMFDDIKLILPSCPPWPPVADFDGDWDVDIYDLEILAGEWLYICEWEPWPDPPVEPHRAPVLWYKFDDTSGTSVADSGTGDANDYTGSVIKFNATLTWDINGGRDSNGCIYLPYGQESYVEATTSGNPLWWIENPDGNGITFSIWENADLTADWSGWSGIFGAWNSDVSTETIEIHCPSPWPPMNEFGPSCNFVNRNPYGPVASTGILHQSYFGGQWNNWVFIHDRSSTPEEMRVYLNGELVADANTNDGAGCALPLTPANIGSFRIGTRGGNWGMWSGWLDDFRIFDYVLTEDEIHWLASEGVVHPAVVLCVANIMPSPPEELETVDFYDFALFAQEWLTVVIWP